MWLLAAYRANKLRNAPVDFEVQLSELRAAVSELGEEIDWEINSDWLPTELRRAALVLVDVLGATIGPPPAVYGCVHVGRGPPCAVCPYLPHASASVRCPVRPLRHAWSSAVFVCSPMVGAIYYLFFILFPQVC